ncbi:MAG: nitrilase-related carbon-nitrogen hydrolase [Cytophagales bacterium]
MFKFNFVVKSLLLASFLFLICMVWCFQFWYTAWLIWFAYVPFLVLIHHIRGNYVKLIFYPFLLILIAYFFAFNWLLLIPKNQLLVFLGVSVEAMADCSPFVIYLLIRKKYNNPRFIWLLPFIVAIQEYLWWHLKIMTPVPMAHTQAPLTYISQYVDLFGNTGATFMIVLINVTVFRYWQMEKSTVFIAQRVMLILAFPVLYSCARVWQFNNHVPSDDGLKISLFRLNIPSDGDDLFENTIENFQRLERDVYLTDSIAFYERKSNDISDLYVWHEGAFSRRIPKMNNYIESIIAENGVPLLTGIEMVDSIKSGLITNGSMVFYPNRSKSDLYTKMNFVNIWENNCIRGKKYHLHKVENKVKTVYKIATPICFEQFIPEHWAKFREQGADVFVQICFETWFRNGFGVEPGISNITALRCMENKVYGARTSNGGASAFFDPLGRRYYRSTSQEVIKGVVHKSNFQPTLYARFPWIGILLVAIAFVGAISIMRKNTSPKKD